MHYSVVKRHCLNFRIITAIVWVSEFLGFLRYNLKNQTGLQMRLSNVLQVHLRGLVRRVRDNEPPHDKTNKMACAPSEDSDQAGHPTSLIRVFAVCLNKYWVLSTQSAKTLIRLGGFYFTVSWKKADREKLSGFQGEVVDPNFLFPYTLNETYNRPPYILATGSTNKTCGQK